MAASSDLELRLLGSFQLVHGGAPVVGFDSDRVRALLVYLAVESGRAHRRESLAALLWPDEPEETALHRLRQALSNLRALLGDRDGATPALLVTRADIRLNPGRGLRSDLASFAALLAACDAHPHRHRERCRPCAARLERAAGLVGGVFLGGLGSRGSEPFAEWAGARADRLHEQACAVLLAVAADHERWGEPERALGYARRALELEAWREAAHRAAMRCLAHVGDRAGALRQYRTCERVLAEELAIEPEPETRALRDAIERGAFPTTPNQPSRPASAQRTPFVGRADELARLLDLVACERLVTLTGPGGMGKTRLALRLAEGLTFDMPGRIWVVELDEIRHPGLVPEAIARALGLDERADPLNGAIERLGEEPALLILDNCEHLRAACAAAVQRLLRACPELTVVATSREALRAGGEAVWPVPPLGLPGAAGVDRDPVTADAVALFLERVRRFRPAFAPDPEALSVVAAICRRLDGMPLAIELAAARARLVPPELLLRQIDDQLALAGPPEAEAPVRLQSLRAAADWSYGLLGARERVLLRRLSAFVGGWTLQAAEAVCADPDGGELARGEVLGGLADLFDKSLVEVSDAPGGARYRLLEPIRQYAAELLEQAGEAAARRQRHAAYFVELAEAAAPRLRGADQRRWIATLERELPNLRAALDWLAARQDVAHCLRLAGALSWFWNQRGYWLEGYERLAAALALPGGAPDSARARALCGIALVAMGLGMHRDALRWSAESLALFDAVGDRAGEAEALNASGLAAAELGDITRAEHAFAAALAISEALGDRWGIGRAAWNLGDCAHARGDLPAARALLERAVVELRAAGAESGVGVVLARLAGVVAAEQAHAQARELYRESLALHRRSGVRFGMVECLRRLAALEPPDEARALLDEARQLARELGRSDLATELADELAAAPAAAG